MYIGDYLAKRELYSPDKLAFIDAGKNPVWRLTFREANQRANKLANFLISQGVGKKDRIAILARDGYEHLDLFFACSKLGAIHVPINFRLTWQELATIFDQTTPKMLIYSGEFHEKVEQIKTIYPLKTCCLDESDLSDGFTYETELQKASGNPVMCETLEEYDTAALIFTGGTTGSPKGAQITHRQIIWNTINTFIHDLTHNDIYLNVFPMFHTGGLFVYTLPQVIFGGTTILTKQFDPVQVLNLIEQEKVTVIVAVPTIYHALASAPNWLQADLSSLRFCQSGGAPVPVSLIEKYTKEKNVSFRQGFGMTEFGPGIFSLASEDAIRKAGSIGRPNYFVDARIIDDNLKFLDAWEKGELVLKGPSYCSGYFNNSQASEAAIDHLGYFHTGDIAFVDDEGYFFIVDRKKDMYISGGENIYPIEIEKAIYRHPSVQMCAVIGVPDAQWGEVGMAYVVLKEEHMLSEAELLNFLSNHLAKFKLPARVEFMEALPMSAVGKILKRELRSRFA